MNESINKNGGRNVIDSDDLELQTMSALVSAMKRFEELAATDIEIDDEAVTSRIVRWFADKYQSKENQTND